MPDFFIYYREIERFEKVKKCKKKAEKLPSFEDELDLCSFA